MKLSVSHRTTYGYRHPVAQSYHMLHLRPLELPRQQVVHHSLLIDPAPSIKTETVDYFGNASVVLGIDEPHTEFLVHARSTVILAAPPHYDIDATAPWEQVIEHARTEDGGADIRVLELTCPSRHAPASREIADFARTSFPSGRPVLAGALDLTQRIFREFQFDATATDISTPVSRVLANRRGVCQDFAHLAIAACRSLGIPARYVSGYLMTKPPPGMPKLVGADASHAWLSVWAPGTGWVDFDPTNGVMPTDEHVTIAHGRDFEDVSPISGVLLGGGDQSMAVAVDVEAVE